MNTERSRFIVGCIVAPLIAPLAALLIIFVLGDDLLDSNYEYSFGDFIEMFGIAGLFLFMGAPIAYAVMLVLGLPIFFIAKRFNYITYWSVTIGCALVAVIPLLLIFARNRFVVYEEPEYGSVLFYSAFFLIGYLVGVVFWFVSGLSKQHAHNQQLNKDAPKSGAPVS